jgi:putative acetyltransferase
MEITRGNFDDPQIIELLEAHLTSARSETAPGSAHALDISGLQSPDIKFWALWDGETLLGVGALKRLSPDHGEVKSMHIRRDKRRVGAGTTLLRHIIAEARHSAMSRLSLETGSWEYFRPARTFYSAHGFLECSPFGDYKSDSDSVFMTLELR